MENSHPELPFAPSVEQALWQARIEARGLNEGYVSTEHLLLALLRQEDSRAAHWLCRQGVSQAEVLATLHRGISRCSCIRPLEEIVLTPRAERVLMLAREEACRRGASEVETDHLLLGLLAEGEGLAAKVLRLVLDRAAMRER